VLATDADLDGVVPKFAKRCCYQVRTCAISMEALVIANDAEVVVFPGCVRQPLMVSNGYHPVLGTLVVEPCRAKMMLGLSWCGVAVEVGLLSLAAAARGAGFHAPNMCHAICGPLNCGPLNCLAGSAIEHATVVSAGWVAWRGA
jgi:hypothetical protein